MSPSAANGVVPPAIDSACITSTVGFMMNSPGLFTWPMTYTLLPLISWIDTVTTGSEMYLASFWLTVLLRSATVLPLASTSPTSGNENEPSGPHQRRPSAGPAPSTR